MPSPDCRSSSTQGERPYARIAHGPLFLRHRQPGSGSSLPHLYHALHVVFLIVLGLGSGWFVQTSYNRAQCVANQYRFSLAPWSKCAKHVVAQTSSSLSIPITVSCCRDATVLSQLDEPLSHTFEESNLHKSRVQKRPKRL